MRRDDRVLRHLVWIKAAAASDLGTLCRGRVLVGVRLMAAAPNGQRLPVMEAAALRHESDVVQTMMEQLISTHAGVQKGGGVCRSAAGSWKEPARRWPAVG